MNAVIAEGQKCAKHLLEIQRLIGHASFFYHSVEGRDLWSTKCGMVVVAVIHAQWGTRGWEGNFRGETEAV